MRDFKEFSAPSSRCGAGIIRSIRLENFMCHSNLEIELGEWVNFITGQNGSGKSAILTALCVAFGCRAKGTQRASTLKDFIKTGCSYAVVQVQLRNQGEEAFKSEIYGDVVIIERRISEASNSTILKDCQGKRVSSRKDDLREIIEHFNIDVENPCMIMSQDKSREFLHSGNDKDKFQFFFKATLLHHVNDLLKNIFEQLRSANALVDDLEASIKPVEKELSELQGKIKNMEHVEELSQQIEQVSKKLAWSWVYDVDRQLQQQSTKIAKLKDRIPTCQAKIDRQLDRVEKLRKCFAEKKDQIARMMDKTSEVRSMKDELQETLTQATKEKLYLEDEHGREMKHMQKMLQQIRMIEQQVRNIHDQHIRDTQAEESEMEEKLKELQSEVDLAHSTLTRLREEESALFECLSAGKSEIKRMVVEIEEYEKRHREISYSIRELSQHQINKVTAFGGDRVINLLRAIETQCHRFQQPPIGPIGAHVNLVNGDTWAPAVDNALGKLLNAFIVTNHRDFLLLRGCAKEANYKNLQIIIYDFSRPRLNIPTHMLPQTRHPTTLSVIHSENPTVINVLVDMGSAERQVLVKDYDVGKAVAFEQKITNLKEVHTLDGYKMFKRGSVQTILPPPKWRKTGRLCSSYDDQINGLEKDASKLKEESYQCRRKKRIAEEELGALEGKLNSTKRLSNYCRQITELNRCDLTKTLGKSLLNRKDSEEKRRESAERVLMSKNLMLQDLKNSRAAEENTSKASSVDELHGEISKVQEEIQESEILLERLRVKANEAKTKAKDLKLSFENLCESAKGDIDAFEEAEGDLLQIERDLNSAEKEKCHYEVIMANKVLPDIIEAQREYQDLESLREKNYNKASIICLESDMEASSNSDGSRPEQLSAHLTRLKKQLQNESQRFSDSIDDLRMKYEKKEPTILRKRQTYKGFREKLNACEKALDQRWGKFQRNANLLKRQLTWQFNGHLRKKGISGHIKVSYEEKTLAVEVKMPQDASSSTVRDTRGLSGGERSFSTLCFALALHEMTEAPFRAMDEFDVFMDAVSRKISLDTLVDFALAQGSQWIFITPHDISMVKQGERIKKQQMAAPRS